MRLVTSLIALAMAIGALVLPTAAQAVDAPTAKVTFAPANAGTLSAGQDLVLDGTLSNPTNVTIPAGTASVYLNQGIVKTRSALSDWLSPKSTSIDEKLGTRLIEVTTPELPAGRSNIPLQITVPAAAISLPATWGARAIAVRVTAGGAEVGQARSSIVWYPGGQTPETRLAMAMPLTVPAGTDGLIPSDQLAIYTGTGGLLSRELELATTDPNVAIGIDPRIIASIRILGDSAPASAREWLALLKAVTNDTFALSYADSDLAVASQAGLKVPPAPDFIIDPKLFPNATVVPNPSSGTQTPTPTPTPSPTGAPITPTVPTPETLMAWDYTLTGVAWPSDATVAGNDLDNFAANGLTTTILSSTNVSFGDLGYTPAAGAKIGDDAALVSDSAVSTLFRQASEAANEAEWRGAMAELSATLAVIGSERPTEPRTLLATLDRTKPGDQFFLSQTLDALFGLAWVAPAPITDLTSAVTTSPVSATLAPQPESAARISTFNSLLGSEAAVATFSSALENPKNLTVERRQTLLAVMANSWLESADWATATDKYLADSRKTVASVQIVKSSAPVLTSTTSRLPITVSNDLDWPVTVYVTVTSPTGILNVISDRVEITIEANSQAKTNVPVETVANGNVTVKATLSSATNVPIGTPYFTNVDVQAGWESILTAIVAVLFVGVFGFGIYRNIAKRRKAKRAGVAEEGTLDATASVDAQPTGSQDT
jgi:hypothetical protein